MTAATRMIEGPGGRTLQIHEAGDPDGPLVVFHHGTPCDGLMPAAWIAHAAATGIRLVSYDRPGYGGSGPQRARTVASAAADVAAIAAALGAERLATFGLSGGGPHALACAALLGDRVAAAAVLGTVAPFDAEGLNFFAGMGRDNWVEFGATLAGRATLEPLLAAEVAERAAAPAASVADGIRTLISAPDQAVLDGGLTDWLHATMVGATAPGPGGLGRRRPRVRRAVGLRPPRDRGSRARLARAPGSLRPGGSRRMGGPRDPAGGRPHRR